MHPELVIKNYVENLAMMETMATKIRAEESAVLLHTVILKYFSPLAWAKCSRISAFS